MNFEEKLNTDLPWSQKFRDFDCKQENEMPFGTQYLAIHCKYRSGDQLARYNEYLDLNKRAYLIAEAFYGIAYDEGNSVCRLGGPALYDYELGKISHPVYVIRGTRARPIVYWLHMCKWFKKIYSRKRKKGGDTLYFKAQRNVPCPYSYSLRHKSFVWKLHGKRVSFSDYWRHFEQKFIDLRYDLKDDPLWKNLAPISIALKRKR